MPDDRSLNYLAMIGAVLNVARTPEYLPVWDGQAPLDFGDDLAALQTGYGAAAAKAARLAGASTGTADEKDDLETALEETLHPLCRALAAHFKKTGDLAVRAEVDVTRTAIERLRDRALVAFGQRVVTLGTTAAAHPDAPRRKITPARVTALDGAVKAFEAAIDNPRGVIVNRSTLRRELKTDVAALMELLPDLDDLVLQFDETELARRFQSAWKQARIIVDAGHGRGEDEEPNPDTPAA